MTPSSSSMKISRILRAKPTRQRGQHYRADAVIVWCFENGWREMLVKFEKQRKYTYVDEIKIAGGAKDLGPLGERAAKAYLLKQIRGSIKLHGTKLVILMSHSDCGAYGGLMTFNNDPEFEKSKHIEYLHAAKDFLCSKLPHPVKVELIFADFNGLWSV